MLSVLNLNPEDAFRNTISPHHSLLVSLIRAYCLRRGAIITGLTVTKLRRTFRNPTLARPCPTFGSVLSGVYPVAANKLVHVSARHLDGSVP